MTASSALQRHAGIDVARALGMLLVYYGHFVEQIMYLGNPAAAAQYKAIYSFHMLFFFVVSGWTGGRRDPEGPFWSYLRYRLVSRVVPYLFFSLLLAFLAQLLPGWYPLADVRTGAGFLQASMSTLLGLPLFNIPMWFVGALVSVECCHYWLMRLGSLQRTVGAALALLVVGLVLNGQIFFFEKGLFFWLLNEVPVVYAFYLLGVILARTRALDRLSAPAWGAVAALSLMVVVLTFDRNAGPFRIIPAVVILLGSHGQSGWFLLTALAGSALLLAVGQIAAGSRLLGYLGRNSLVALAMNGVFYHFFNQPVAVWFQTNFPQHGWSVGLVSGMVTLLCLGVSLPAIAVAERWLPQLCGRPRAQGPLLPALWR